MISTRTMKLRLLSTRMMPNEVAKQKNNDKCGCYAQVKQQMRELSTRTMQMTLLSIRTMQMRPLSKRTMANEVAKQDNDGK